MTNIFISYNPKVEAEQSLALRLQTLGALYGLSVSLPDRIGTTDLKPATKERINKSKIFIVFSTRNLTRFVVEEIKYAAALRKKIIAVYDKDVKNINLNGVVEIEYDHTAGPPEKLLKEILKHTGYGTVKKQSGSTVKKEEESIGGFFLAALGLLLPFICFGS
jgi:hypothetical protein